MKDYSLEFLKSYLKQKEAMNFETSFGFAKHCSELLRDKDKENEGREIVIRVLDGIDKIDKEVHGIWHEMIEIAGLYPYIDIGKISGSSSLLRYEYNRSRYLKGVYFHEEQNNISNMLQAGKAVVLSAPTSYGKSLLIEEIVASKKYQNIVIIQPTLALIDETRKKMQKYSKEYKIIVSTLQKPDKTKGNIFLFTGERVTFPPKTVPVVIRVPAC